MKWNYLDLFSGIGGFRLGLEQAGFQFEWEGHSEIDNSANSVYKKHFSNSEELNDIRAITIDKLPKIDLITFGFPCTDLSVAGKRKGLHGQQSGLFFEAMRIIEYCKPKIFIFENVKGLLSSNDGRDFTTVLRKIADIGLYECEWQLCNTKWLLPQNRERIYFIGHLRGRSGPKVFPFGAISGDSDKSQQETQGKGKRIWSTCINSGYGKNRGGGELFVKDNRLKAIGKTGDNAQAFRVYDPLGISSTLGSNGGGLDAKTALYKVERKITEDNKTGIRRLTPIECLRLQGFSDDYLEVEYANAKEAHASQILHELWKTTHQIAREGWRPGIITSLFTPEILLTGVYVGWLSWKVARECAEKRRELQGATNWSEGFLQALRVAEECGYSPYRRESFEQFARELDKPLQELPYDRTQIREILCNAELWEEAQRTWPLRYAFATEKERQKRTSLNPDGPRTAARVSDTQRYKMIGNAVSVPIVRAIGERLLK